MLAVDRGQAAAALHDCAAHAPKARPAWAACTTTRHRGASYTAALYFARVVRAYAVASMMAASARAFPSRHPALRGGLFVIPPHPFPREVLVFRKDPSKINSLNARSPMLPSISQRPISKLVRNVASALDAPISSNTSLSRAIPPADSAARKPRSCWSPNWSMVLSFISSTTWHSKRHLETAEAEEIQLSPTSCG